MSIELSPAGKQEPESFLSTRVGVLTLVLLCAVQFLDIGALNLL